jgi:hypothetical protein
MIQQVIPMNNVMTIKCEVPSADLSLIILSS